MITGEKIECMLIKSWEDFKNYYNINAASCAHRYFDEHLREWTKKKAEKKLKDSHWICWNEDDLMLHLGRYFYNLRSIESNSNKEFLNIEMHFNKNLNHSNFKDYSFDDKLRKKGGLEKELGRFPKLDLIIASEYEDNPGPFLLCAEAKCFHANVMFGNVEGKIEKDIKTLAAIEKLGITKKIAYIIFDDNYYNRRDPKDLKKIAEHYSKEHGIEDKLKILHHDSKIKIDCLGYINRVN
jgi:hypothetical protein